MTTSSAPPTVTPTRGPNNISLSSFTCPLFCYLLKTATNRKQNSSSCFFFTSSPSHSPSPAPSFSPSPLTFPPLPLSSPFTNQPLVIYWNIRATGRRSPLPSLISTSSFLTARIRTPFVSRYPSSILLFLFFIFLLSGMAWHGMAWRGVAWRGVVYFSIP